MTDHEKKMLIHLLFAQRQQIDASLRLLMGPDAEAEQTKQGKKPLTFLGKDDTREPGAGA